MALTKVIGEGLGNLDENITFSTASKGVHLGVTSATSSNLISDYEEGTWTPTVTSGTVVVATNSANYTKVGRSVTLFCRILTFSDTTSGSSFAISGLPFTISVDGNDEGHVGDAWGQSMGDHRSLFFYSASGNITNVGSYYGGTTATYNQVTYSNFDNNTNMLVKLHYFTT